MGGWRLSSKADVIALGPGPGGHPETVEFVRRLASQTRLPLILDADGINAFAGKSSQSPEKAERSF